MLPAQPKILKHDSGKDARRGFMIRLILTVVLLALAAGTLQGRGWATEVHSLPMRFEWRQKGPAETCGKTCGSWISAVGMITTDTPAEFHAFVEGVTCEALPLCSTPRVDRPSAPWCWAT